MFPARIVIHSRIGTPLSLCSGVAFGEGIVQLDYGDVLREAIEE